MTVQSAVEAYDIYKEHFETGRLVQSTWHDTASDGRALACGLGVLGPTVSGPGDCPSAVMPRWLAQMVPWFFDNQEPADAFDWGLRFYAELKRLNGVVPFSVVHDWQAHVVGPLAIEWAEKKNREVALHKALIELHEKAFSGTKSDKETWLGVLKPALKDVYLFRYAKADAKADAYANANADAYADAYAYAYAYANANAYRKNLKRLADGMVDCLARVPS